ncbi:MAG TPA: EamA family transporter [Ruminococcaceae bacterium]|nr:EamA family transporter [Oscillospiraceae bacterium]
MEKRVRQGVLPVITALIWGVAFVFQKQGAAHLGNFTFNAARFFLGFLVLCVFLALRRLIGKKNAEKRKSNPKKVWIGGFCCGAALFAASALQQLGIADTDAGKTAFITALYIVLVPLFGLFFGKKVTATVWISVAVAVAGMYFLCVHGGFSVRKSDLILLLCAVMYAVQILAIDHFVQDVDGVSMSCVQMLTACVLSLIGAVLTETVTWQALLDCAVPILYVGIMSSGVAYTLQVLAQIGTNPTVVSLLLSMESVFGALAGAMISGERMLPTEIVGCVLMFAAVLLAQIPVKKKK